MTLAKVPNALSATRLAMIPVLWFLALAAPEARMLFTALLAFAFLTDVVDGFLCRKYNLATAFGAKLDRIADELLALNAAGWLYVLRRELFVGYWPIIGALLFAMALSVALQYWRYRRRVAFHLYSGKLANLTIAVFVCYTLVAGPRAWFVYLLAAILGYSLLEEMILICTRASIDEHDTSMFASRSGESEEGAEA